jgi:DNA-binding transcriptional regulator YiaG
MSAAELKAWREARNISRTELAKLLFVGAFTVWRWESGEENIPPFMELTLEQLETTMLPNRGFY